MSAKNDGKGLRVLLVEDDAGDVGRMREIFAASDLVADYRVAPDGDTAIASLRRETPFESGARPELVVLDLGIPKPDGFEVLDVIRSSPALRRIPVVVLTRSRKDQDVVRSYDLGAFGFVPKPVRIERFEAIVRGLIVAWEETGAEASD